MLFTSMKTKITQAVFLLVGFLMTVTAITSVLFFEKKFKQNISLQQSTLLDSLATEIDERIFDFMVELDNLSDGITPSLIGDPDQAQRLLDAQKRQRIFFDNSLFLFSESGKLLAASPRELNFIGKDFSFREYFQETVKTGTICVSAPFASIQKKSHPIIMFTTPVYDSKNRIIAVLGGSVDLREQHYLRSLAALKLGQNGFLSLYDTQRVVLMHPDKARVLRQDPPGSNEMLDQALTGFEGSAETSTQGGLPVLRSVKRLKSTSWILAVSYPLKEAYAPLHTARDYFLAGSLAAALLSLFIVWPLMKYLTKPLLSFTRHLEQLPTIKEGAKRLVPVGSDDEIGQMARTFNGMLLDLEQRESALQEQKEFAESLVLNSSLPTFVIDAGHKILFWNKACEELTGVQAAELVGTDRHWSAFYQQQHPTLADVIIDGSFDTLPLLQMKCEQSHLLHAGWHGEGWYERMKRYLFLDAAPICNDKGETVAAIQTIRDFTDLKRAELDLERSRDFYLTLFENFPAMIWRSGTDAKTNYFNQNWLDFTGRTLAQELGDGWAEGVHPEDLDSCLSTYLGAFQTREPFQMEYRLRNQDGEYRWIVDMGRPFYGLDGNFAGFIGTCYDVTERQEAADKILKLSRVIEQSPNAVLIATLMGTIEYVNPRTVEVTGYPAEELVGQNVQLLVPAGAAQSLQQALHQVVDQGREWRGEIAACNKGGDLSWDQVTISPIKGMEGKVTHFVCTKEDISQRKQFELSLRESEERYRQLFENNPHPMWAYDLASLAFLAVNHEAVRHYGYSREEFLAMTINDLLPQDEGAAGLAGGAQGDASPLRRHVKKDGSVVMVETSSHVMPFAGVEAEIVLVHDVTERVRAEEEKLALEHQLTQSQKMEAIGTLTGGIAHDFNNILTAIIGYATMMQLELGEGDSLQRKVREILRAAERAANLTRSLLAYSRRQASNPAPVGLNSIIGNVEILLHRLIPENIELKAQLAKDELSIMADPGQMEQIVMNLVVNARDAMPDGGMLGIATETVTLDHDFIAAHGYGRAGSYALMTVADSGSGMDEKTRDRIFEPFFTTKEPGKGTGLGLAMVYAIVKQHDGFINCYSELGHGTVFRIYLPLIDAPTQKEAAPADQEIRRGEESILLVEDDAVIREMVGELLEDFGYSVIKAVDGEDAVQKFKEAPGAVHMVILDVIMPKMNGKEAGNAISALCPDVKMLFMSGYTADIVAESFIKGDPCHFVAKPIKIDELLNKVRDLLDQA